MIALPLIPDPEARPPYGCGANAEPYPDRWPQLDPTGLTMLDICARIERNSITLFALSMSPSIIPIHDDILLKTFDYLARGTGGIHCGACSARGAIEVLEEIGRRVFRDLALDRTLWERYFPDIQASEGECGEPLLLPELSRMASEFGISEADVTSSISRLKRRKLIDDK